MTTEEATPTESEQTSETTTTTDTEATAEPAATEAAPTTETAVAESTPTNTTTEQDQLGQPRRSDARSTGTLASRLCRPGAHIQAMIDAEFRDRALYLPGAGTLVLADLHLGRAATSTVQVPLGERRDITSRLEDLLDRYRPTRVVLAGDVLHSFSGTPGEAAESFDRAVRLVESRDTELAITPGNHDAMLGGLWSGDSVVEFTLEARTRAREDTSGEGEDNGENGNTRSGKRDGTIVVTHGHEPPETEAGTYVVGHDHPAIEIEGQRRPCYLYGPGAYGNADVLMLPAFTRLAGGVEINGLHARDLQSPLLTDLGKFRPIVYDEGSEETLWFPPLTEFRSML